MSARIGIDLGGTKIHGVVLEADGSTSASERRPTPRGDYDATVQAIADLAAALDRGRGRPVGVGTPGSPDPDSGRMRNCNSTWLNGRPLRRDLELRLGRSVRIANDADCFAVSESEDGAAAGERIVFGVILGTGVGGGIVADGRLLPGRSGLTGEWGHTPLPYFRSTVEERALTARHCYCGRLNCIETFLSGPGLLRTFRELGTAGPDVETPEQVVALANADAGASGRSAGHRALAVYCHMLSRSLAQIVNVLDPGVIVLGGGISSVEAIYAPVRAQIADSVFGGQCRARVVPPRWGDASGVRGAARLWRIGESP